MSYNDYDTLIVALLGIWCILICWRIFRRRRISGFLFLALSIFMLLLPDQGSRSLRHLSLIMSQMLFMSSAILMGTTERDKLTLLSKTATSSDLLLGRISADSGPQKVSMSSLENVLIIISSSLLIVASLLYCYVCNEPLTNALPMLITGVALGAYSLIKSIKP